MEIRIKYIYIYNEEAIKHDTHDEPGVMVHRKKVIDINQHKTDDCNVALVMDIYKGPKVLFESYG